MVSEHTSIQGVLTLELRDPAGALLERHVVHNLITNRGKSLLAQLLGGKTNGAITLAIGVGSGTAAPTPDDPGLATKLGEAKAEMTEPFVISGQVRVNVRSTIADGGTADNPLPLTEAGILVRVGQEAPVVFNRVTFPVINKGPNMSLLLSWDLNF
ncbi:hypothetical protein [Nannocystis sp.]|uniref:hypothetical protein n=1 Tax=Nannocystis sp. TaxID=1962667 RepID=UPI0024207EB3|nr:hypothetical protein [Nannocystis sp.]MBK7828161.1 hypothetical protein [Nannocystis sp.]MBK9753600.1 hypothetical protein [Nannocystis sp.]